MIDGIRRRFGKSPEENWNADLELQPETQETTELPTDTAVLLAASKLPEPSSETYPSDYYVIIVRTAIEQGGKYGGHQISLPWLRMILAGLESKHIEPEMMWDQDILSADESSTLPKIPAYNDLFPSDPDAPSGPHPPS
jgi:hypothetical protein